MKSLPCLTSKKGEGERERERRSASLRLSHQFDINPHFSRLLIRRLRNHLCAPRLWSSLSLSQFEHPLFRRKLRRRDLIGGSHEEEFR